MRLWRMVILVALASGGFAGAVGARVVVNEVMSNEPNGFTGLEWFELYNNSTQSVDLSFYQFDAAGSQFTLNRIMPPHGFLVVCRKLVGTPASPGFETQWGNNSTVWGDSPIENYPVVEVSFSLPNVSGSVLASILGVTESVLGWTTSGADGISWERESPTSDVIKPCGSPYHSTPGHINSWAPLAFDLSLDTVMVAPVLGGAQMTLVVTSRSLIVFTGGEITLFYIDPSDTLRADSQVAVLPLPSIDTGMTTVVGQLILLGGTYHRLGAQLGPDDRDYNNRKNFVAPGSDFPPIELSELLANPTGAIQTEWIEVRNREDSAVSLNGWRIGDSLHVSGVMAAIATVPAQGFLVFAEDTALFRAGYPAFDGLLATASLWPSLNNSGDLVRLIDSFGLTADTFSYSSTFDSNQTWGKAEGSTTRWGRSVDNGGTPGALNLVRFEPSAQSLKVTVKPQIISPDGDGVDDSTVISIEAPQAKSFTVRIYDVQGRLVRTFEHKAVDLALQYEWRGQDDGGGRLPEGIYILYVEAEGVESIKKTIVVAP